MRPKSRSFRCPFVLLMIAGFVSVGIADQKPGGEEHPGILQAFLDGPMAEVEEIVFAVRQPGVDHWYGNFGYYATSEDHKVYWAKGRLCKLNLQTGLLTVLLEDLKGAVRDPQVHYGGRRILFSYRKGNSDYYHLYEINVDGTGLTQITAGPFDDIEPTYLPDGNIIFVSSRCRRWVNCWLTQVATLYTCDSKGNNIRQISANIEHDNTPWPLPDGRVLYTRWEYVDRSQVSYHHLWTSHPDGTHQMVYYGNMHPGTLMIDAKPIPGGNKIVATFSPNHGLPEHDGQVAVVSPEGGPDNLDFAEVISGDAESYRDPFPITEHCFLVAEKTRLLILDGRGRQQEIFRLQPEWIKEGAQCHEPRPVLRRPRESVIPSAVDLEQPTGNMLLTDVYTGRRMEGVDRREIRSLMVVETLPKPINFTGGMEPLSYGGTFTLERILGTVPVLEDGSAFFTLPAHRSFFFIALDEAGNSVKRMQSFVSVQPGETIGCVGCHEERTYTPDHERVGTLHAVHGQPSPVTPMEGMPDVFDFPRDIQPIFDRHCLKCHDTSRRAGGVLLTGDRGPMYSHSYFMLTARQQVADGRNLAKSNYAPRAIGAPASPLMEKLGPGHYGVDVSEQERRLVSLWIETGAPFPGTYAALGTGMIGGYTRNNQDQLDIQWQSVYQAIFVMKRRCGTCHQNATALPTRPSDSMGMPPWRIEYGDPRLRFSRHILYNLTRPEHSVLIQAPLSKDAGGYGICRVQPEGSSSRSKAVFEDVSDPDYQALLSSILVTKKRLDEIKRFDMPGFRPHEAYLREMKRFGVVPADYRGEDFEIDVYATDRTYWKSLWWQPKAPN